MSRKWEREQQLESELALTRSMIRASLAGHPGDARDDQCQLEQLRSPAQRVAAWRPYDA
jgi:hypothetical protein